MSRPQNDQTLNRFIYYHHDAGALINDIVSKIAKLSRKEILKEDTKRHEFQINRLNESIERVNYFILTLTHASDEKKSFEEIIDACKNLLGFEELKKTVDEFDKNSVITSDRIKQVKRKLEEIIANLELQIRFFQKYFKELKTELENSVTDPCSEKKAEALKICLKYLGIDLISYLHKETIENKEALLESLKKIDKIEASLIQSFSNGNREKCHADVVSIMQCEIISELQKYHSVNNNGEGFDKSRGCIKEATTTELVNRTLQYLEFLGLDYLTEKLKEKKSAGKQNLSCNFFLSQQGKQQQALSSFNLMPRYQ